MANLTRIKNNQITDSTILANTKIVPGSIVGSLFNSNLTMTSDVTITGNLTVQGSSTYLTVASTNTYVNDPLIVLNNAFSGTNTYDIGLLINRGNQITTALIWKESNKQFELTYTTDTGTSYGAINNSGYANLKVGNLSVVSASTLGNLDVTGNINAWFGTLSGDLLIGGSDLTANTATFNLLNSTVTTLNFGGAVTTANVGAGTGTFTINNPTLVGQQPTQALYNTTATTMNFAGAATALNMGAATGTVSLNNANVWVPNATTIGGAQATVALLNVNATTVNAFGAATTIAVGANSGTITIGNPTLVGTQTTQNLYNTTATTMNFAGAATSVVAGAATGTFNIRNANLYLPNATTIYSGQATLTAFNENVTNLSIGGVATALTLGATSGVANIRNANLYLPNATTIYSGQATVALLNVNATTVNAFQAATTANIGATTGTMQINNPTLVGINTTQNVYDTVATTVNAFGAATSINIGANSGTLTLDNPTVVGSQTSVNLWNTTSTTVNAFQAATTANIGAITGTMQINNPTLVGINTTQAVYNTVATTVNAFGAATALSIGAGSGTLTANNANIWVPNATAIGGAQATVALLNVNATTVNAFGAATALNMGAATGTATINNATINLEGNVNINEVTTSTNSTSGALVVDGGVGIAGNLNVGQNVVITGNLTVQGDVTTLNTATLDVEDLNITVAKGAATSAAANGAGLTVDGASATILYTDATTSWDLNKITRVTDATDTTSETTGALRVAGGAAIAKDLFVGGGDIITSATTFNLLDATATTVNAFGAATTIDLGATSGTLTINNPTVVGSQSSQDLYNTAATTLNFAGAATALTVGATTGTLSLRNANIWMPNATTIAGAQTIVALFNTNTTTVNAFQAATTANIGATSGTMQINNPTLVGFNTTQAVYNTVATTVNAFQAATTANIGATTGTMQINNPTLVGFNTTQAVYNTVATTVNAFGAATALNIGAATGTLTANNANVWVPNATAIGGAQATVALLNVNATTVNAFGAATALNLGATSGTATISNPTLVGTQTTQNLYNTTATTMNFAGAATAITIGATTGTANIRNALTTITGVANILATTDSTQFNNGALVVNGGVGSAGNIHVKSTKQFIVGQDLVGEVYLPDATAQFFSNVSGYSQVNQQNISSNTFASSDFIATADNGSDTQGYIDLGINSSTYSQTTYTIVKANDGYLYVQGNATTGGGNLAIGTGAANDIIFFTGGTLAANEVARFNNTYGNLQLKQTTAATSQTTGALTVAGGAGFAKNVYVANGATINNAQSAENFLVKGKNSTALIYANSNADSVIIGGGHFGGSGGNTTVQGGVTLKVDATDTMMLPRGSTAQRPSNSGNVDVSGMIRFNSTINNMEFYDGSIWQTAGSVFTIISSRQFSGATGGLYGNVDGTNVAFTLQSESTTAATIVSINGVIQIPVLAYDVSTTTLTFTEAPALGDVIDVRCLATTTIVSTLASGNGLNQFIADNNGAGIWSGSSSTIQRVNVDSAGVVQLMNGTALGYDETAVSVTTSATTIDSFPVATYRAAKYIITFTNGTTSYETTEILVIHDGTTATRTQYATISTSGSSLGTYSATISGGNVLLQCAAVSGTGTVKAFATYIKA